MISQKLKKYKQAIATQL